MRFGRFFCIFFVFALKISLGYADQGPGTLLTASSVVFETTATIMNRVNLSGSGSAPNPSNFLAVTLATTDAFPPYTMGAIGPTQYMLCCNGIICTYNSTTGSPDGVLNTLSGNFFHSILNSSFLSSNPRIRYDKGTSRWYIIMNNFNPTSSAPNKILVAASNTATITSQTTWTFFTFTPGEHSSFPSTYFADFPTLGVDNNFLVIGVNALNVDTYITSDAFVIFKQSIINGAPTVYAFRNLIDLTTGTGLETPQGVDVFDTTSTKGYLIGVDHTSDVTPSAAQALMIRSITLVNNIPNISGNCGVTIQRTALPINVPHQFNTIGSSGYLLPSDDRLCISHVRNGILYTAHNIGVDNTGVSTGTVTRDACRWYMIPITQISTSAFVNPTQYGTLYANTSSNDLNQRSYFMPAVITNAQNTMVLNCCTSGANEFINAAYALRYQNDPSGKLLTQALFTSSSYGYNPPTEPLNVGGRRWGDYANASIDPTDDSSIWLIQEYCNTTNSYGLQVDKLSFLNPPTITSVTPSSVVKHNPSVNLTITAAAQSGQGFFDPSNPPSSLTVAIDDVDVLSITSVTATQIQLVISTQSSLKGFKTITVTNPDGQTTQAVNMFQITNN